MNKFSDFNKLNTFSIAARHLSFSKTAEELFITQAAVSQQIRSLELVLGFKLFHRLTRQITLTQKGRILAQSATQSLDEISSSINQLRQDKLSGVLTISTLPSFAMKWLIPRLEKFNQQYPQINVHLHASDQLTDFKKDGVDLVVRYGHRPSPTMHSIMLMKEDVFLVASPKIITTAKPLKQPSDLKHHVIIEDEIDYNYRSYGIRKEIDWEEFSAFLGVDISKNRKLILSQAHLVLQAAIEGQGVAIARSALVEDDLNSGRLIKVFANKVISSPGYHIVCPKSTKNYQRIKLFSTWLLDEAQKNTI